MIEFEPPLLCESCKYELDYDRSKYSYHEDECLKYTCKICDDFFFHDTGGMKYEDDMFCEKCTTDTLKLAKYFQEDCGLDDSDALICLNELKPI